MDIQAEVLKIEKSMIENGHILTDWRDSTYYKTIGCDLCGEIFSISKHEKRYYRDSYKRMDDKKEIKQCAKNPNGLKADYTPESLQVVTWSSCSYCGKKLSSKGQITTGFCGASNGCNKRSKNPKLRKGAKFYPLQKFPTPRINDSDYPVFGYVLLQSADTGELFCSMLGKDEKIYHTRINGIAGNCDIMVQYKTFLNYVSLLDDNEKITLSQDDDTMILTLSHGNSRAKFKGMAKAELEYISDMLGGNFEVKEF